MGDVGLYNEEGETEKYDDYVSKWNYVMGAYDAEVAFAEKYLSKGYVCSVVDLCCGPGKVVKRISEKLKGVKEIYFIDISRKFLEIAKNQSVKSKEIYTILGDVIDVPLPSEKADCVISSFAYHHVKDEDKAKYIQQAKKMLKVGGIIIIAENYLTDTSDFYKFVEDDTVSVHGSDPGMIKFMRDIAKSSDTEFKVPKKFAMKQFIEAGFKLIEDRKIWPTDNRLSKDEGTFVQVWKKT